MYTIFFILSSTVSRPLLAYTFDFFYSQPLVGRFMWLFHVYGSRVWQHRVLIVSSSTVYMRYLLTNYNFVPVYELQNYFEYYLLIVCDLFSLPESRFSSYDYIFF